MIRLATIGTSWITKSFIEGTDIAEGCFELTAVYSRNYERGEEFLKEIGKTAKIYTDINELAKSDIVDAVYIASPNSLHFEQAMLMVKNKKHVIVEKPIVITEEEFLKLMEAANENNVIAMEAYIPIHLPARKILKENIGKLGRIQYSRFQFCQHSSKYEDYLQGKNPNIFNPEFATGTLMDLGIYCIYPAIDLFGVPDSVTTYATFLHNGSDSSVNSIFKYSDHIVNVVSTKICQSDTPSEIVGDCGKIDIGLISKYENMVLYGDDKEVLTGEMTKSQYMSYEARDFYRYITSPEETRAEYNEINSIAHTVCSIMEMMRLQSGINFNN